MMALPALIPTTDGGIFPSFSAGWRMTEEQFMQDLHWSWLNSMKIRASWGQLGNQNIGIYPYQAVMENEGNYTFDNSSLSTGYAQNQVCKPEYNMGDYYRY